MRSRAHSKAAQKVEQKAVKKEKHLGPWTELDSERSKARSTAVPMVEQRAERIATAAPMALNWNLAAPTDLH